MGLRETGREVWREVGGGWGGVGRGCVLEHRLTLRLIELPYKDPSIGGAQAIGASRRRFDHERRRATRIEGHVAAAAAAADAAADASGLRQGMQ